MSSPAIDMVEWDPFTTLPIQPTTVQTTRAVRVGRSYQLDRDVPDTTYAFPRHHYWVRTADLGKAPVNVSHSMVEILMRHNRGHTTHPRPTARQAPLTPP